MLATFTQVCYYGPMLKVITTEKVLIGLPLEEAEELVEAFTAACNYVAENSKDFARRRNAIALQHEFYHTIREKFGLPAQYAISVMRIVAGKWKVSKRKVPYFRREFPTLQSNRDFSFTKRNGLSVRTLTGRTKKITYSDNGGRFSTEADLGAAKLLISKGKVFLAFTVSQEVETKKEGGVIGVDVGINHAAVTSEKGFFDTSHAYKKKRHAYRKRRSSLQAKKDTGGNTRSVRGALKRLSGKEARLTRNEVHVVSKRFVAHAVAQGASRVVFEDVRGIRRGKWNHGWSNYMFRKFSTYKLNQVGITVELVDPAYTSQMCSNCGHTEKRNRKGQNFKCVQCSYSLNADLNAAYNIRLRSIINTANQSAGQVPSTSGTSQRALEVREEASASAVPVRQAASL